MPGYKYTGTLELDDFEAFRAGLAEWTPGEPSEALDTALYFGPQTLTMLDAHGAGPMNAEQEAALRAELARTHVDVEFRLVGDDGQVHGLIAENTPIGVKQHLGMEAGPLGHVEVNGTVVRVGPAHLWSRF